MRARAMSDGVTAHGTARRPMIVAVVIALVSLGAAPAGAAEGKAKRTVKEAAKTGGRTAKEGALTFGHATRAFFTGGVQSAKDAWHDGAAKTKQAAKTGAAATKHAAE